MIEKMLIHDEGLRLKPYHCTAGKLTIGIGRNLDDVGITDAEARFMLMNDVIRVQRALSENLIYQGLDEVRQTALVNMAFQLGVRGCFRFKNMWAALAANDWEAAHDEALDSNWARQTPQRAKRIAAILLNGNFDSYKGLV